MKDRILAGTGMGMAVGILAVLFAGPNLSTAVATVCTTVAAFTASVICAQYKHEPDNVEILCDSCGGSGVYNGMRGAGGFGIICLDCAGSGKQSAVPFKARRILSDIRIVRIANYNEFSDRERGDQAEVSYEDFLAGKMPHLSR